MKMAFQVHVTEWLLSLYPELICVSRDHLHSFNYNKERLKMQDLCPREETLRNI